MDGLSQYRNYQTETTRPEDWVPLLYDGARRFTDKARVSLEAGDLEAASKYTGKAQAILTELSAALNFDAGEVTFNLFRLYDYWNWRLSQGLINREAQALQEVSAALMDMHEAWAEVAKQVRAERAVRSVG